MKVHLATATMVTPFTFHRKFLGLGYVHAYALEDPFLSNNAHILHEFYDIERQEPATIADAILARAPDLVGFGCYVWNTPHVLRIAEELKRASPRVAVMLGGPEVDFHYRKILEENASVDYVCVGEGEKSFREFLVALLSGKGPESVAGIAFRGAEGPALSGFREPEKNLDRYPSPYLAGVLGVDEVCGGGYYQTTRGCPFRCAFCAYGRERPYSEFSMERVRAELKFFKEHGARGLFCVDSTFNLKQDRALEMLDILGEEPAETGLWMEAHPEYLNKVFVERLEKLPVSYLGLGLQSTNPETMKNINRPWDPGKIGEVLSNLARHRNCVLGLELIMGLPGDDLEAFKETLSWAYGKEPGNVFAQPLQVLPQTALHRDKERFEIEEGGIASYHEIRSNCTFPSEQIQVGRAMVRWNRQIQTLFYRLAKISGLPAGDLMEEWAWHAYDAGMMNVLDEFQAGRMNSECISEAAGSFEQYCGPVFTRQGLPDVSRQMGELFRYYYLRRSVTSPAAHYFDTLDVHAITTDPRHNRIISKDGLPAGASLEGAIKETFDFDMGKLWPLTSADELEAIEEEPHTYLFITDERGAALAVAI